MCVCCAGRRKGHYRCFGFLDLHLPVHCVSCCDLRHGEVLKIVPAHLFPTSPLIDVSRFSLESVIDPSSHLAQCHSIISSRCMLCILLLVTYNLMILSFLSERHKFVPTETWPRLPVKLIVHTLLSDGHFIASPSRIRWRVL
jgi:hypothetical protein